MPRVAYFKSTSVVDADQNSEIASLKTRMASVESGKVSTDAFSSAIAQKADTSYVDSTLGSRITAAQLESSLSTKANQSYVDAVLSGKAEQAALTSLTVAVGNRVVAENALITALKDALYIESAEGSGVEFDYSTLLN